MKLYHATKLENKDNILLCGLAPGMIKTCDHLLVENGIYGFTELKDALGFAKDQCWNGGIAVFSFNTDNPILDPEYDDSDFGIAFFLNTDENVSAKLEYEVEF